MEFLKKIWLYFNSKIRLLFVIALMIIMGLVYSDMAPKREATMLPTINKKDEKKCKSLVLKYSDKAKNRTLIKNKNDQYYSDSSVTPDRFKWSLKYSYTTGSYSAKHLLTGLWPDNVSVYIFTQPHPHKKKNKKFHDFIDLQVSCTVRKRIYPYASTIGTIFTLHNFILDFHFEDYLNSQEIAYEECKVSSTDIDSYGLCEEW